MEFWEFLIQQEGDRSWLPLESPSVEILEGRYRVVARSSRPNTLTEVRVTHYASTEMPPVRRVRKRSSRTNLEGLIVVLPFTRLQPGLWDLRCTGDLMSELMGEPWQYAVQLDVVPQSMDLPEHWEPDSAVTEMAEASVDPLDQLETSPVAALASTTDIPNLEQVARSDQLPAAEPEIASLEPALNEYPELDAAEVNAAEINATEVTAAVDPLDQRDLLDQVDQDQLDQDQTFDQSAIDRAVEPGELAEHSIAAILQQVEQVSEQIVDSAFREFPELMVAPEAQAAAVPSFPQLQVILERETYVIQRGETLALTGRVEFATEEVPWPAAISELRVRLYDPQTSEILMDEVYSIDNRVPPFPFSGTISLPEHYQTYLVLGELIFQGLSPEGTLQVLVSRSFNVTTDLHELIESIANDFPDPEALPAEAAIPEVTELPASELTRLNQHSLAFQRSSQPLPPQLRPPSVARTHAALELPSFAPVHEATPRRESAPPEPETEQISTSAADLLPSPQADALNLDGIPHLDLTDATDSIEADLAATAEATSSDPARLEPTDRQTLSDAEDAADLFLDWEGLGRPVPLWQKRARAGELSNKPEDVSFRALNLQDRFLERLQSLATNPELSAKLGAIEAAESHANAALVPLTEADKTEAIQSIQQSIGFDADLAAHEIVVDDELEAAVTRRHQMNADADGPEPIDGPILPADEPIPTPRLQLPSGEMVAGQPIPITIKLPNLVARIYVKLWLRDRQTRDLVSTPRWIIDFVPDGFGNQMARTEVVVPPGCLKVQFEAIAVEIATQRESDKASMTRPIVPPDLSPYSLDELEI